MYIRIYFAQKMTRLTRKIKAMNKQVWSKTHEAQVMLYCHLALKRINKLTNTMKTVSKVLHKTSIESTLEIEHLSFVCL